MTLHLYNTSGRNKAEFVPMDKSEVKLYTCGPTVYNYAHIGNFRTYIFEDVLKRILTRQGLKVNHVMNVTDVGHLESDADEGDDKMLVAAAKQQKSPYEIADYYTKAFFDDFDKLGCLMPETVCKATDHIQDMIDMVKTLEEKGFTYTVDGNVYFDISKFPDYSKLGNLNLEDMISGKRVVVDERKKHPADFALWFSTESSKYKDQIMQWDSPWSKGFPGWHIECSAMSSRYLGDRIDIHCGGIDHIPVHHTNEIAQSECCFGHKWVNWWVHGEFLILDKGKMSKSSGEFLTLKVFCDKGFTPLHYRYFCLGAHYRSQLSFNWEAAENARNTYEGLCQRVLSWKFAPGKVDQGKVAEYRKRFDECIYDDMNMPQALAVLWEVVRHSELKDPTKLAIVLDFDEVLGLNLVHVEKPVLDDEKMDLIGRREAARQEKDWGASDAIRDELLEMGVVLKDTAEGTDWYLRVD